MAIEEREIRSPLQSVQRAARLLNELAHRRRPAPVAEIASALNLDRAIVYRLVKTLTREGLVEHVPGGYKVGPKALVLGNSYLDGLIVRQLALPYSVALLDRLHDEPWAVSLMMPIGGEMTVIDTVWNSNAPLQMQLSMGRRFAMAETAGGRAILARCSAPQVSVYVGHSVAASLADELEAIREIGGLAFMKDLVPGGSAMAAAIVEPTSGRPVASLGIAGLELDPWMTSNSAVALALLRAVDAISRVFP